ncbi:hypothetical protein BT69DRAFT_1402627 [Atractiella rhizophila]|nr:hypothetical protein BT69DRAFT_1402627 [Atractiella rhizophila]
MALLQKIATTVELLTPSYAQPSSPSSSVGSDGANFFDTTLDGPDSVNYCPGTRESAQSFSPFKAATAQVQQAKRDQVVGEDIIQLAQYEVEVPHGTDHFAQPFTWQQTAFMDHRAPRTSIQAIETPPPDQQFLTLRQVWYQTPPTTPPVAVAESIVNGVDTPPTGSVHPSKKFTWQQKQNFPSVISPANWRRAYKYEMSSGVSASLTNSTSCVNRDSDEKGVSVSSHALLKTSVYPESEVYFNTPAKTASLQNNGHRMMHPPCPMPHHTTHGSNGVGQHSESTHRRSPLKHHNKGQELELPFVRDLPPHFLLGVEFVEHRHDICGFSTPKWYDEEAKENYWTCV